MTRRDEACRGRLRGFTLLEVMIALAVVSIGLVAASSSIAQLTANGVYLRDKTMAHWIAMNKLSELRLAETWPDVGKSDDEIDYGSQTWHWTAEVTETQVENLRRIDLTVARKDKKNEVVVARLSGFAGQPRSASGVPSPWTGAAAGGPQDGADQPGDENTETPPPADEGDTGGNQGDFGGDDSGDSGESGDQEQQ